MNQTLMTVVDYCRYRDLSRKAFYDHKKHGALDGCFAKKPGYSKDFVIRELADAALQENVSAIHRVGGMATKAKFRQKVDQDVKAFVHDAVLDLSRLPLAELQRRNELEKLLIRQIERRTLENEYILAVDIEKTAYDAGVQIREQLESLPVRLGPLLAAENDAWECQKLLDSEIYHVLMNLYNNLKIKDKIDEK